MFGCVIFHVKSAITHHPLDEPRPPPHIPRHLSAREAQGERKIERDWFDKNGSVVKVFFLFRTDTVQRLDIVTIHSQRPK